MPIGHPGTKLQRNHMYGAPLRRTTGLPVAQGCTARMEEKTDGSAWVVFADDLGRPSR
ncbi:hypothetical protein [Azospirillum largimobile]